MINTFILPGILVFAVNSILITLIVKGLVFLKWYRLLSWVPEAATYLASTGMFYWLFSATPEEPEKRIVLVAVTAFAITWLRPVIRYALKGRKEARFREFFRWISRQMFKSLCLYGAALFSALYLSHGHVHVAFFTNRDVPAIVSRFGFYLFWVYVLITVVFFISGLGLIVLTSLSNRGNDGFLSDKISDLDIEETFSTITGSIFLASLIIDLVYLCVWYHVLWPVFFVIGVLYLLHVYYEKKRTRSLMDIGLGAFIAVLYIGLILAVSLPASCLSIYHLLKLFMTDRVHGSDPSLAYFHALPMLKLLFAGLSGILYLAHKTLSPRPAPATDEPDEKPSDNPEDFVKTYDHKSEVIYQNRRERIEGNSESIIEKNDTVEINGSRNIEVGKDVKAMVGNEYSLHVNQSASINTDKSLILTARRNIQIFSFDSHIRIETNGATIVISEDGDINIRGKNITFHATGKITMSENELTPTEAHRDAESKFNSKDFEGAIHEFGKHIERDPKDAIAFKYRGLAYYYSGDWEKALSDLTRVIDITALNPEAHTFYSRGEIYRNRKDYPKAIADYDKACQLMPNHPDYVSARGSAYYCLDRLEPAFADFNKALSLNPDHADSCNEMACMYALKEQGSDYLSFSQALEYAEKAVRFNRHWSTLDTLASVYASGGRFEDALMTELEAYELLKATQGDNPYRETMEGLIDAFRENKTFLEWKLNIQPTIM